MSSGLKEKYIRLLEDICTIETPSGHVENINALVDKLDSFAGENGYQTERFPFENAGDFLLIKSGESSGKKPVLFMAHMDTVHQVGAFGKEAVTRDGDWMMGPGVMDCKGGIVTALWVMECLKNGCERPVYLLLTSDEEATGRFSGQKGYDIMTDIARNCVAVLNMEPGRYDEVTVGRKGILNMRADVTGVAGHAGNAYFDAASAIREAAHMVLEIEGMSQRGGVTYNCGIIGGGTAKNVISDACTMEIDIRVSNMDEMAQAEVKMYEVAKHCVDKNTKREVTVTSKRPPMKVTDDNLKLLKVWNRCAEKLGLPAFKQLIRGGGSDAAYTVLAGVPTLCSCAAVGFCEHTLSEKLDLSSFDDRIALLCEVIRNVSEIERKG